MRSGTCWRQWGEIKWSDLKDWRRFGSENILNDKAAIKGLEFRDPTWAVEITPVFRQKGASGPFEVYLQFRKLK